MKKFKSLLLLFACFMAMMFVVSCESKVKVDFVVDGTTYATVEVKEGSNVTLPEEPSKTGYNFAGWYVNDVQFTEEAKVNGNVTVEAKFTGKVYTLSFGTTQKNVTYGEPVGTLPDYPEKTGYQGTGWYIVNTEITADYVWNYDGNRTATAKYEVQTYQVTFGTNVVNVAYGAKLGKLPEVPAVKGNTGKWYIDGVEVTANTKWNFAENKTATAQYTPNDYTLTFGTQVVTITYGTKIGTKYQDPTVVAGYDTSWMIDEEVITADTVFNWDENQTALLNKVARTDTEYTVIHYQQNLNTTGYTKVAEATLTGKTGDSTNAVANTYEHYANKYFSQKPIEGDGSTVVEIYYDAETYEITLVKNNGQENETIYGKYGQMIGSILTPTKTDYSFNGWEVEGTKVSGTTTITGEMTLSATWENYVTVKNITNTNFAGITRENGVYTIYNPGTDGYATIIDPTLTAEKNYDYIVKFKFSSINDMGFKLVYLDANRNIVNCYELGYSTAKQQFYISAVNEERTLWTEDTWAALGSMSDVVANGEFYVRLFKKGTATKLSIGPSLGKLDWSCWFDNPAWNGWTPEYGIPAFMVYGRGQAADNAYVEVSNIDYHLATELDKQLVEYTPDGAYEQWGVYFNNTFKFWNQSYSQIVVGNPGRHSEGWPCWTSYRATNMDYADAFTFTTKVEMNAANNYSIGFGLYTDNGETGAWKDQIMISYKSNLSKAWISFHSPTGGARNDENSWGQITGDLLELYKNGVFYMSIKYENGTVSVGIGATANDISYLITSGQNSGDWIKPYTNAACKPGFIVFGDKNDTQDYVIFSDFSYERTYAATFDFANGDAKQFVKVNDQGLVVLPTEPVKTGYAFGGWYNGEVAFDATKALTTDVKLTAKWVANEYTLTINEQQVTVHYGEKIGTLPEVPEVAGKDGAWYIEFTQITADTVWTYLENKTALAKYGEKFKVTFDGTEQQVFENECAIKPANPTKEHQTFTGWYLADGTRFDFATPITADVTLVSQWSDYDTKLQYLNEDVYTGFDFDGSKFVFSNAGKVGNDYGLYSLWDTNWTAQENFQISYHIKSNAHAFKAGFELYTETGVADSRFLVQYSGQTVYMEGVDYEPYRFNDAGYGVIWGRWLEYINSGDYYIGLKHQGVNTYIYFGKTLASLELLIAFADPTWNTFAGQSVIPHIYFRSMTETACSVEVDDIRYHVPTATEMAYANGSEISWADNANYLGFAKSFDTINVGIPDHYAALKPSTAIAASDVFTISYKVNITDPIKANVGFLLPSSTDYGAKSEYVLLYRNGALETWSAHKWAFDGSGTASEEWYRAGVDDSIVLSGEFYLQLRKVGNCIYLDFGKTKDTMTQIFWAISDWNWSNVGACVPMICVQGRDASSNDRIIFSEIEYSVPAYATFDGAIVLADADRKVTAPTNEPSKTGYTFNGWYNGDVAFDFNTVLTGKVELTSKFTANTYKLTIGDQELDVTYGEKIGTLPEVPPQTNYTGYWYIGETKITANTVWNYTENQTATAEYEETGTKVTVTFDNQETKVFVNDPVTKPADPTQAGKQFVAWVKADGTVYDFTTPVIEDLALTSTWSTLVNSVGYIDETLYEGFTFDGSKYTFTNAGKVPATPSGYDYGIYKVWDSTWTATDNFQLTYHVKTTANAYKFGFEFYDAAGNADSRFLVQYDGSTIYIEGIDYEPFKYNDKSYGALWGRFLDYINSGDYYVSVRKVGVKTAFYLGKDLTNLESCVGFDDPTWNTFAGQTVMPKIYFRSMLDTKVNVEVDDIRYTIPTASQLAYAFGSESSWADNATYVGWNKSADTLNVGIPNHYTALKPNADIVASDVFTLSYKVKVKDPIKVHIGFLLPAAGDDYGAKSEYVLLYRFGEQETWTAHMYNFDGTRGADKTSYINSVDDSIVLSGEFYLQLRKVGKNIYLDFGKTKDTMTNILWCDSDSNWSNVGACVPMICVVGRDSECTDRLVFSEIEYSVPTYATLDGTIVLADADGKIAKPADPTKNGYTFAGWYADDAAFDFNVAITGNVALTSKWYNYE